MTENERVRAIRQETGQTMREFGSVLGVGSSTISDIENGRRRLTTPMTRLICEKFGVREAWLRNGDGPMRESEPSRDELDDVLDKWGLPREFRGLFLAYRNLKTDTAREAVRQFIRDAAAEIAAEEKKTVSEPTNPKPWNEMPKEEKLAELSRQLDEEEATEGKKPQSGGSATA